MSEFINCSNFHRTESGVNLAQICQLHLKTVAALPCEIQILIKIKIKSIYVFD